MAVRQVAAGLVVASGPPSASGRLRSPGQPVGRQRLGRAAAVLERSQPEPRPAVRQADRAAAASGVGSRRGSPAGRGLAGRPPAPRPSAGRLQQPGDGRQAPATSTAVAGSAPGVRPPAPRGAASTCAVQRQRVLLAADLSRQLGHLEVRLPERPPRGAGRSPCPAGARACRRSRPADFSSRSRSSLNCPLEQEVLADAGVERLDRLDGQVVAGLAICWPVSSASPGRAAWRSFGPATRAGVGPGLHGQHRRQPDHPGQQRRRRAGHRRCGAASASAALPRQRLAPGRDRLVGHPPLDVLGQRPARGVAILGLERHRLQADGLQGRVDRRVELPRRRELAPLHLAEDLADVVALERRLAGQQAVERRAQAVDVATAGPAGPGRRGPARGSCRPACPARCRAASRRCRWPRRARASARRRRARLGPAQRLGQAPVDHQRLAVLADDDVARLDVAVQHAAAVGVVDRVADVDEPPQQLAQLQRPAAGVVS